MSTRSSFGRSPATIAGLMVVLLASVSISLVAQPANEAREQSAATFGYDRAHEITLTGTIQEVISHPAAGSPVGLHVLVGGSEGLVDAHLGPYMSKETMDALHMGTPVEIVGAMEKIHGTDYLLVRVLMVGGQTITVRSPHGFLRQVQSPNPHRQNQKASGFASSGGAR